MLSAAVCWGVSSASCRAQGRTHLKRGAWCISGEEKKKDLWSAIRLVLTRLNCFNGAQPQQMQGDWINSGVKPLGVSTFHRHNIIVSRQLHEAFELSAMSSRTGNRTFPWGKEHLIWPRCVSIQTIARGNPNAGTLPGEAKGCTQHSMDSHSRFHTRK